MIIDSNRHHLNFQEPLERWSCINKTWVKDPKVRYLFSCTFTSEELSILDPKHNWNKYQVDVFLDGNNVQLVFDCYNENKDTIITHQFIKPFYYFNCFPEFKKEVNKYSKIVGSVEEFLLDVSKNTDETKE